MKSPYNILVFPCGSEIGLELHRSLNTSTHINLIGANSTSDHGEYVYSNYHDCLPFVESSDFIDKLNELISNLNIDAIYPTMDKVIYLLKKNEHRLKCTVISSVIKTAETCFNKRITMETLKGIVSIPEEFVINSISNFPIYVKPKEGYGSRNNYIIYSQKELESTLLRHPTIDFLIQEYLPGEEFTIDCFTDYSGKLRLHSARKRSRVMNGISVRTELVSSDDEEFTIIAKNINNVIEFRGAWFFQMKRAKNGELKLLEVACRIAGSSGIQRLRGVNLPLLTIYDHFGQEVQIDPNNYSIKVDRALNERFKINCVFDYAYIDFDDCIVINNAINKFMITFIIECLNKGKKIILISRHQGNLLEQLKNLRIYDLFDEVIHLRKSEKKSTFIIQENSIFIDDSFTERTEVKSARNIPVFSPDMIETLALS